MSLARQMVRFAGELRQAGFSAPSGAVLDGLRALEKVGIRRQSDVKAALAAVFVDRPERLALFQLLFDRYWVGGAGEGDSPGSGAAREEATREGAGRKAVSEGAAGPARGEMRSVTPRTALLTEYGVALGEADEDEDEVESNPQGLHGLAYSREERLLHTDFGRVGPEDLAELRRLAAKVARRLATRRSRRLRAASAARGGRIDLPGTLRRALHHAGEPVKLYWREPRIQRTRLTVLCDVSGSMAEYARVLLYFIHALQHTPGSQVESFVFSTRLERVTAQLAHPDPERAVSRALGAAGTGNGTRIGESLQELHQRHASYALGPGRVVLILSDGLDRGEPDLITTGMRRLKGRCRRLVWLNPLAGDERYEPLALGMSLARPYIDVLAPAHNLASLARLERWL